MRCAVIPPAPTWSFGSGPGPVRSEAFVCAKALAHASAANAAISARMEAFIGDVL